MELLNQFIPVELNMLEVIGLTIFSYFTSAVTAAFGLGGGVLMLAAMATVIPAIFVIPVHGAVQLGSNGGRAWALRNHVNWTIFFYFLAGSLIGAAVASQIVIVLPQALLRLILGCFIIWIVWTPKLSKRYVDLKTFIVIGMATTFASMFVGATGLLIGAFISPEILGRMTTVSTHAVCATLQHGLKIVVFGLLGFAFWQWIPLIIAMIATGLIGTYTGKKLLEKIPEKYFGIIFKLLLTTLALRLIVLAILDFWPFQESI